MLAHLDRNRLFVDRAVEKMNRPADEAVDNDGLSANNKFRLGIAEAGNDNMCSCPSLIDHDEFTAVLAKMPLVLPEGDDGGAKRREACLLYTSDAADD